MDDIGFNVCIGKDNSKKNKKNKLIVEKSLICVVEHGNV